MPQPILIDGAWVPSRGARIREIRNPATLECIDSVADASAADVDAAVQAASHAQRDWWKLPGPEKAKHLHEIATRLRANPGTVLAADLIERVATTGQPVTRQLR